MATFWGTGESEIILDDNIYNFFYAQAGDDTILMVNDAESDNVYGGPGYDIISYELYSFGVSVDLSGGGGLDYLSDIEGVTGSYYGDTLRGNWLNNSIVGLSGDDQLYGMGGNDSILGGDGDDYIFGGDGSDFIEGGSGADYIDGGSDYGNDTASYVNSLAAVTISLDGAGGSGGDAEGDTLHDIESLVGSNFGDSLTGGIDNDSIWGEDGDDQIAGGAGYDYLYGGDGNDTIWGEDGSGEILGGEGDDEVFGGAGSDRVDGGSGNDWVWGEDGDDEIVGGGGDDQIIGGSGADRMDGGSGSDTIWGGTGDDVYVVDNSYDVVDETDGNGIDTVQSSISFNLANTARVLGAVENLTLLGSSGLSGTGNVVNNMITGNAGANVLNGGAGADNMRGGAGNDVYIVDNASDIVSESLPFSSGVDTVESSISFNLANTARAFGAVENLKLLGSGGISGTGNARNNVVTGNVGANLLDGGAGDDVLNGGAGNDRLIGGAGYDSFIFNTALNGSSNVDTIVDFNVVQDTIRLDNAVMSALGGAFESGEFWKSTSGLAHDGNDRIIYETDTGWLNYDSNGSAAGGSVHIARLSPNLALTAGDFLVI